MRTETVLVTGAASGIGRATTKKFHDRGWEVIATDVDQEGLSDLPDGVSTEVMDVSDSESIRETVEGLRPGYDGLNCLVNNAGFAVTGPIEDVSSDRLRSQMDVLVHGPHELVRETLPMLRNSSGTVVTVTSVLGRVAFPGSGAYCAGKFAAEALGDVLRMELEDIEVTLVEPAWVETDFSDRADEELHSRDGSSQYEWIYRGYASGGPLDGGPLAVTPERVAETIVKAGTASEPRSRYPIGWQARAVLASRHLPDRLVDPVRTGIVRVLGWF